MLIECKKIKASLSCIIACQTKGVIYININNVLSIYNHKHSLLKSKVKFCK